MESNSEDEYYQYESSGSEYNISHSGSESSVFDESSNPDDSDTDIAAAREWCEINILSPPPPPPRFPFRGTPSINFEIPEPNNVLYFFNKFIDDNIVSHITTETNRYAEQLTRNAPTTSKGLQWRETTDSEIRVFLGLVILQSILKKPDQQLYWSKKSTISTPFFRECMSYQRYCQIKKFLHFSNNEDYNPNEHPNPKLNKIWPIYEDFSKKFSKFYSLDRDVTIDESLLLYKGRLGWKQYIPLKRARFGIKSYLLCESKSGYVWSFIIYTGKGTVINQNYAAYGLTSQIVLSLMEPLFNLGHCLITDNFYSSPQLSDILLTKQTDTYGTAKANRKEMPPLMHTKKVPKGKIIGYQRGKLLALRWRDKKDIIMLSTVHNTETIAVKKRNEERIKPVVVNDYNSTMGGVDRVDQHISDYPMTRKRGKVYYKKIFYHLIELALWNSYLLYKKNGGQYTPLQFRMNLIEIIFETYHSCMFMPKAGRPGTTPTPLRLSNRHFPEFIPPTQKKNNPTRQCAMCSRKRDNTGNRIRKETRYLCPNCQVPLCVVPCFKDYHTKTNI